MNKTLNKVFKKTGLQMLEKGQFFTRKRTKKFNTVLFIGLQNFEPLYSLDLNING